MTNGELIEHLKQFPTDASVVVAYQLFSNYELLDADEIKFHPAPGKPRLMFKNGHWEPSGYEAQYVLRNGQVMRYDERTWPKDEKPEFLSILAFPGN